MANIYLDKLNEMVDEINKMTSEVDKIEAIYHLTSNCTYNYYCGRITYNDFFHLMLKLITDPEETKYITERDIAISELIENNILLSDFYKKYIDIYNKNFKPKKMDYEFKISIYKEFREFLKYMGCYKLYNHLLAKKNIYFNPSINYSVCINNRENSFIVIKEKNPFNRYFTMSHEIAHAYENFVMKDIKSYFDIGYNVEIFSILFNRIFIEYIFNHNILNQEEKELLINSFEANYYNFLLQSLFITEIIKSKKYCLYDYDIFMKSKKYSVKCRLTDHNYAIGNIVSLNLLNDWRNNDQLFINRLPELIKNIRNMKLNELINNFDNQEMVVSEIKHLIKKK